MTDSTVIMMDKMSAQVQEQILQTYFDVKSGNRYSLIRTNMGGCDFSERPYTYLDTYGDFNLNTFRLAPEDTNLKMPMFKRINQLNPDVEYYFAPWTAPNWMKTNNMPDGKGSLVQDPAYLSTWAKYFMKYIQAYRDQGLNFQHFSLQNEPLAGMYTPHEWQETGWNATGENNFLLNYIVPEMIANGFDDITVQVFDGQRPETFSNYPENALKGAEKYLGDGGIKGFAVAIHWYADWVVDKFDKLSGKGLDKVYRKLHRTFGDNFYILGTEACMPIYKYPDWRTAADDRGNFHNGMRYSEDIIVDLNNHVVGWTDWNMVLDLSGGPNWAGNRHDAPIIVDPETDTYWKNPTFYHMGHFSKFLDQSFHVLEVSSGEDNDSDVIMTAATNDLFEVYVVLNKSFEAQTVKITSADGKTYQQEMEPRSVRTVVIKT